MNIKPKLLATAILFALHSGWFHSCKDGRHGL